MEALALSDLRNHILFRGHTRLNLMDPVGDSATTGTTNLNNLINMWKDRVVESHNYSWRHATFSFSVDAANPEKDMPGDFQAPTSFYTDQRSLVGLSQQEFRDKVLDGLDDTGTVTHYIPVGNQNGAQRFRFWPIESDTIFCDYVKLFKDLKEASDTLTVTVGVPSGVVGTFQQALIEGVLVDLFEYQNDVQKSSMAANKYAAFVEELKELDVDRSKVHELDSHGAGGFSVPRLPNKFGTRRHW